MNDPELIWRIGRWIARHESGAARLGWSSGEVILRIHLGKIVSVEGLDCERLADRLGCKSQGHGDLLDEARALARNGDVRETEAVGSAKEMLEEAILAWLLDGERELELVDGEPDVPEGPTISITHAIVELVLADTANETHRAILPDKGVLLRRTGKFLELYSPLRLSEDADLIVAKITGQRTVEEIVTRSPHERDDVLRLLAALVATGMLEPIPVVIPGDEDDLLPDDLPEDSPTTRRLPVSWIVAAVAVLLVIIGALSWYMARSGGPAAPTEDGHWTVVVDMGCEPEDLRRVLQKANENPKSLRAVRTTLDDGEECWRLVWGDFASPELASSELGAIPASLARDGFEPHVIELVEAADGGVAEGDDTPDS